MQILPSNCKDVRGRLEATLERLGKKSIALYQVHWPLAAEDVKPTFTTLAELQKEGKITHIGVSNFGVSFIFHYDLCCLRYFGVSS